MTACNSTAPWVTRLCSTSLEMSDFLLFGVKQSRLGYHFVSTTKLTSHGLLYRNCINITNMWHFLEMLDYNHWNSQRIKKATLQQKVNTQLTSHGLLYRNCTNNTNMWHFLPRKRYNWKKLKKINLTKWDSWTYSLRSYYYNSNVMDKWSLF